MGGGGRAAELAVVQALRGTGPACPRLHPVLTADLPACPSPVLCPSHPRHPQDATYDEVEGGGERRHSWRQMVSASSTPRVRRRGARGRAWWWWLLRWRPPLRRRPLPPHTAPTPTAHPQSLMAALLVLEGMILPAFLKPQWRPFAMPSPHPDDIGEAERRAWAAARPAPHLACCCWPPAPSSSPALLAAAPAVPRRSHAVSGVAAPGSAQGQRAAQGHPQRAAGKGGARKRRRPAARHRRHAVRWVEMGHRGGAQRPVCGSATFTPSPAPGPDPSHRRPSPRAPVPPAGTACARPSQWASGGITKALPPTATTSPTARGLPASAARRGRSAPPSAPSSAAPTKRQVQRTGSKGMCAWRQGLRLRLQQPSSPAAAPPLPPHRCQPCRPPHRRRRGTGA